MKNYKVGIIGNGFVGGSQAYAFKPVSEVRIFDIDPNKSTHTLFEVLECDFVFICVPTPMKSSGSQDLSYIEFVFEQLTPGPIFIIKSTILPGTTSYLIQKYPNLNIVFNPEFLTEKNAKLDVLSQDRIVLGGDENLLDKVKELYNARFSDQIFVCTDPTTAELIKYMNNTFLATKVSIMNEFKRLAEALEADWEKAVEGFSYDKRIGNSHLRVPGPDGKLGYGGTCFPKDVNALIQLGNLLGTPMNTIEAGWKTNLEVRPEMDWNLLLGRAVVN
jgi:nucleotide sugar dehydrogenase